MIAAVVVDDVAAEVGRDAAVDGTAHATNDHTVFWGSLFTPVIAGGGVVVGIVVNIVDDGGGVVFVFIFVMNSSCGPVDVADSPRLEHCRDRGKNTINNN